MSLPNKKRKFSLDDSPLPPIDMASPKERKDSTDAMASSSVGSDDTAAMALRAVAALDGQSLTMKRHPLKKRKAEESVLEEDDQALGLAPLAPVVPEDKKPTPPKSNTTEKTTFTTALDHLDALGDESSSLGSKKAKLKTEEGGDEESSSGTLASSNQRVLMEALMSSSSAGSHYYRDRLESWGGMSDLSSAMDGRMDAAAAHLAASALHYTGLLEDVTAAANSCSASVDSQEGSAEDVPSRISLKSERKHSDGGSSSGLPNLQAFVDAAMATVGGQLAEIAGAVEMAAAGTDVASITSDYLRKEPGIDSDVSSTASPLIGPVSDFASLGGRPRSLSTSSKPLSVDYDAVAAAVDAAQAATGALDLQSLTVAAPPPVSSVVLPSTKKGPTAPRPSAPISAPLPPSSHSEKDMEAIRARARAAAGYVPPSADTPAPRPPLKKRPKQPPRVLPLSCRRDRPAIPDVPVSTPRISNPRRQQQQPPPMTFSSSNHTSSSATKASNQKWDEMLECLIQFREERRAEELKGATAKEKEEWEWDGNVPTTYKTKDGKALGRWVNNQRSAKHKGALRKEREDKLVGTGLKWSVLSTSSWSDMMDELRIYVKEKTSNGGVWDGNVPTNYRIKGSSNGADGDEEKNLGRWINRQRSLFQAGKLRKDRQKELEEIGLKWSVLSTSSWESMFETLCAYVKERRAADVNNAWDGNVPANYKTNDNPPRALGRWINRQRSAYTKNKLKKEYVDQLTSLGLRWSVHERRGPHVVSNSSPDEEEV